MKFEFEFDEQKLKANALGMLGKAEGFFGNVGNKLGEKFGEGFGKAKTKATEVGIVALTGLGEFKDTINDKISEKLPEFDESDIPEKFKEYMKNRKQG